ncbi:MAG: Fic family protein [Candidatus Electrothrix sp. AR3]|nr:Fic family protein [Candidatus Electrothrix sp. AR3]
MEPEGRQLVHYKAPPPDAVPEEMRCFLRWLNGQSSLDGLIRAALAHYRFVAIHPFDDGNGRIARALTDMALAQDGLGSNVGHCANTTCTCMDTLLI